MIYIYYILVRVYINYDTLRSRNKYKCIYIHIKINTKLFNNLFIIIVFVIFKLSIFIVFL